MPSVLSRLTAALSDRYTIEREVGSGGMAVVYLAQDLKHERQVAIKVLRPELAAAVGAERFFREIKITANLSHPHILPLLDSGDADGFLYYVMPFVDGESLREKLNREKQLSVDEALKITSQVADALNSAHRQDVVHRDIKPENILLREGHAVVADFGIAVAVSSAGAERLTETGMSLGTPAYMSPEQVAGDREIDGRSDIYSLACVLYEMLAGDPPFVASTPRAVLAKHVTDPAPPITTVRSGVRAPVATTITKALGKAPADRFDSARDFAEALFTKADEAADEKKSIVVLPFTSLSPDSDDEYFADGLTDELITDLSKIKKIRVIARNSSMKLKGTEQDHCEIGHELRVRYVLDGSVRRAGVDLRITAQLVDVNDGSPVWADRYTGTVDNVFDFQERVSISIVDALNVELSGQETEALAQRPIPNLMAYEHYLKARRDIYGFNHESLNRAARHLSDGLAIVGENAPLLRGLGMVHYQMLNAGVTEDESLIDEVERCAAGITGLDPVDPSAFLLTGLAHVLRSDFRSAVLTLYRAFLRDPGDPDTMLWLSVGMLSTGQSERSKTILDELERIDPLAPLSHGLVAYTAFFQGRFEDMLVPFRRSLELDPDLPIALWCAVRIFASAGLTHEAVAAADRLQEKHPATPFAESSRFFAAALEGRTEQMAEPSEELRIWASRDCEWGQFLADAYAVAGLEAQAMAWLEIAVGAGFLNHQFLKEHDPFLECLRGSPRFENLLRRVARELKDFEIQLDAIVGADVRPGSNQ